MKSESISFETLKEDVRRLAEGLVTPRQLQDEDSIFAQDAAYRIVNLAESLKTQCSY